MYEALLLRFELVLALLGVGSILKSVYNGWVHRKIVKPLEKVEQMSERVEHIEEKQEQMSERQETQIDAITALARSHNENEDFDEEQFRERVGRRGGPDDFLRGDS